MISNSLKIKPGFVVAYRLLPKDMPTNPLKVWVGVVKFLGDTSLVGYLLIQFGYRDLQRLGKFFECH